MLNRKNIPDMEGWIKLSDRDILSFIETCSEMSMLQYIINDSVVGLYSSVSNLSLHILCKEDKYRILCSHPDGLCWDEFSGSFIVLTYQICDYFKKYLFLLE